MQRIYKRRIKHVIALMLVVFIAALPSVGLAADKTFPDMQGHWAETYVSALVEKGAIAGMPDGQFYPNDSMTFPQFVKIVICNEYGEIEPVDGYWASGYMQKALDMGLIQSEEIGNIEQINRFDAVRIVHNALTNIYEEEDADDTSIIETFEDYPSCRSCRGPYDGEIGQCYVKGIITGKPGPVFDGEAGLTRAEGSIIIMKMLDPTLRTPPQALFYNEDA